MEVVHHGNLALAGLLQLLHEARRFGAVVPVKFLRFRHAGPVARDLDFNRNLDLRARRFSRCPRVSHRGTDLVDVLRANVAELDLGAPVEHIQRGF